MAPCDASTDSDTGRNDAARQREVMVNLDHGYRYIKEACAILQKTDTLDHAIFKGIKPSPAAVIQDIDSLYGKINYMPIIILKDGAEATMLASFQKVKPVAYEFVFGRGNFKLLDSIKVISSISRTWLNTLWPSLWAGRDREMAVDETSTTKAGAG